MIIDLGEGLGNRFILTSAAEQGSVQGLTLHAVRGKGSNHTRSRFVKVPCVCILRRAWAKPRCNPQLHLGVEADTSFERAASLCRECRTGLTVGDGVHDLSALLGNLCNGLDGTCRFQSFSQLEPS